MLEMRISSLIHLVLNINLIFICWRFNIFSIITSLTLQGYSYVAPSIIFSDNTVSSDLLSNGKENQPSEGHIIYANHFKVRDSC
jgi:hypothetical protein